MLRRWHILVMIAVVLLATCLAAAAKLRATPKYDRIQVGMSVNEVEVILGRDHSAYWRPGLDILRGPRVWELDEGTVVVDFRWKFESNDGEIVRAGVNWIEITPRPPLERAAWLAGWR